jgi:hypothetical protein
MKDREVTIERQFRRHMSLPGCAAAPTTLPRCVAPAPPLYPLPLSVHVRSLLVRRVTSSCNCWDQSACGKASPGWSHQIGTGHAGFEATPGHGVGSKLRLGELGRILGGLQHTLKTVASDSEEFDFVPVLAHINQLVN